MATTGNGTTDLIDLGQGQNVDTTVTVTTDQIDPLAAMLNLPTGPEPTVPGQGCWDECKRQDEKRKEDCDVFRRRVARAMKEYGCPSIVRGYKKTRRTKATCATKKKRKSGCGC